MERIKFMALTLRQKKEEITKWLNFIKTGKSYFLTEWQINTLKTMHARLEILRNYK